MGRGKRKAPQRYPRTTARVQRVRRVVTHVPVLRTVNGAGEKEQPQMSNLEAFARDELQRAGLFDKDSDYGGMMGDAIMKMVKMFADEGHSGFSANMAISLFERVARFEPLTPLTGEGAEWVEVGGGVFQNKRCPHVFKENGEAYDSTGRVFRLPNGSCYTGRGSRVPITFPYRPKTEYVDVEK